MERTDPKKTATLSVLFNDVLEKREASLLAGLEKDIALLGTTPDRTIAKQISTDGPAKADRGNGTVVSRYQPNDILYRNLLRKAPQFKGARDPDQDHWNVEWLRALKSGDVTMQKIARAKSDQAYFRANELYEGVLDATSPTALTDGAASGLLPQSYTNVIEIAKTAAAVIAPLCSNFTTPGNTLRVPTVGAVTAATASEGAAVGQSAMAVASVMMILTKLGARLILSDETIADSAFNVMQISGSRVGQAIGLLEDTQILTTNGTSPNITGALVGGNVDETTTTELISADLGILFFALGKAYQPNGTWLAGTVVATLLTGLVDGTGRQVLQTPQGMAGPVTDVATPTAIGTIYGRPVYHVPAVAGDLIFGDLSSYGWVRKGGIEAKISTDAGWDTDTTQFKFTQRCDGQILDAAGIKEMSALATLG